ncbi:hypothetical protein hrd7_01120 [Leptolinea sp. HRD-7]|nr:hypothetical protein hrd7_01120 [Leptolinea sp. HRD-7]
MKIPEWIKKPHRAWLPVSIFAIGGFAAGFFLPLRFSLAMRNDLLFPLLLISITVWAAFRLPSPWDSAISASLILSFFSACLAALWRTGTHGVYDVFGLLPWFDSTGYYSESLRLLDGGIFSQIAARRPIFPALFSALLLITGRNLRTTILLLTLISGLSTWILVRQIKSSDKNAVLPAVTTALLFLFYRKFNGAVLTDTLGYSLGVLSLAFLWNAISSKRFSSVLAGLFCLTLGQAARPGAVFTLPLLFLWIVFLFETHVRWWKRGVLAALVVISGLLVNVTVTAVLAPGVSASYANFSYQVYSLVNGGTGWHKALEDHPELFNGKDEGEAARQILRISWNTFQKDPSKAVNTSLRAVGAFFSAAPSSAYNYLDTSSTPREVSPQTALLEFSLRWLANVLLIISLIMAVFFRRDERLTLLFALNTGVILSLPIAAPWDIENMRAYSVSIAGLALGVGYVVLFLSWKATRRSVAKESETNGIVIGLAYGLAAMLLTGILVIPLVIRITAVVPEESTIHCPNGQETFVTRIDTGTTIQVGKTSDPYSIPYERYLKDLDQFPDALVGQGLKVIPEGYVISQQNDALHGGNAFWLAGPKDVMNPTGRQAVYCGHFRPVSDSFQVFFAESVIEP